MEREPPPRPLSGVARFAFNPTPPYSFELTVHKPAGWHWFTLGEVWEGEAEILFSAVRLESGLPIGIKARSAGTLARPRVLVNAFAARPLAAAERRELKSLLRRALDVDSDITGFIRLARRDAVLKRVLPPLYGMREGNGAGLWASLLLTVTLQMAPIKRSMAMLRALQTHYGERFRFEARTVTLWPTPARISQAPLRELRTRCKLGYRARVIKKVARQLIAGFPTLDELAQMSPEQATAKLLELYGIGEYSAAMVTPHVAFPLDVWSVQIFARLLRVRIPRKRDPRDFILRVQRAAERRWGPWRGLALVYVLNALDRFEARNG
jgi:DNA-3-methyladenine glycosylase II